MINKTIHGLIFGFYIIFALLCGMGGLVLAGMSFMMMCMIIIIILVICLSVHGFFIGKHIFAFGRNVILDIEDGHHHLQSEMGNIRSVMDSFTSILDTVIDQQTSLDKKVDILLKKPTLASELQSLDVPVSDKIMSLQDHYPDVHKTQHMQQSTFLPERAEEFDTQKLPDFLSEPEEDKGFSEEFMAYPVKAPPHPQDKNNFSEKTMMPSAPRIFETNKDTLSEEEFADVTHIMQNASQHKDTLKHNMSETHIENEEFFEDITKIMRHNIGEKATQSPPPVASHISTKQESKESASSATDTALQKPVTPKPVLSASSFPMKHDLADKKVELPSLKELLPQETSLGQQERLSKSFVPEAVPSLESLIKQEIVPPVKNTPDAQVPPQSQIPPPPVQASSPQPTPQAPPASAVPKAPVPQFKTQAPQAPVPVMKPAPEEEAKALPADNLSQIIRHALERNAIDTFIRPVIDSVSRETCYFEAYSYLRDAQEKHHPPKYFLPQAERDGLHTTIDRILLTRSVQIVRALQNAGQKVGVFSNISVKSVTDGDFMEELLEMVREKHDLSQGVVLEFSQRQLNYMTSMRIEKMTRLSSHGFVFSLDNVERPLPDLRELTAVGFRFLKLTPKDLDKGVSIAGKLVKGNEMKRLCNELNMKLVIIHVQDHNDMLTVMNYGADFLQGDLLGGVKRLDQLDLQAP